MNNHNKFNWDEILDFIKAKTVVPIIGSDLSRLRTDKELYDHITEKLAVKLGTPLPNNQELTLLEFVDKYQNQNVSINIIKNIKIIYDQIDKSLYNLQSLVHLAKITDFEFYISTSFDTLLEQAILENRCADENCFNTFNYSIPQYARTSQKLTKDITLFNLFGSIGQNNFAITEEEVLEYVFSIKNNLDNIPDLLENIADKDFLLIGCNFPDWLLRFIIRTISNSPFSSKRRVGKIIADNTTYQDVKLSSFLRNYGAIIIPIGDKNKTKEGEKPLFKNTVEFVSELYNRWTERSADPSEQYDGSVFLSYASEDRNLVEKYYSGLKEHGVQVWFDARNLESGAQYSDRIIDAIRDCKFFIPLISENAIRNERRYVVDKEWKLAEARWKLNRDYDFIKPYIIDKTHVTDTRIPEFLRNNLTIEQLEDPNKLIDQIISNF